MNQGQFEALLIAQERTLEAIERQNALLTKLLKAVAPNVSKPAITKRTSRKPVKNE